MYKGGGVSVRAGAIRGRGQCMSWCHWGEGSVYELVPLGEGSVYELVPLGEGSVYELVPLGGGVSVRAGAIKGRGQCRSWCH